MSKPAELVVASDDGAVAYLTARRPDGSVVGLHLRILSMLDAARQFAGRLGVMKLYMTSGPDGKHSHSSLHYSGMAADLRRWNFDDSQLRRFLQDLSTWCGPDYDVVLEDTHIHVEYQPKGPGSAGVRNA